MKYLSEVPNIRFMLRVISCTVFAAILLTACQEPEQAMAPDARSVELASGSRTQPENAAPPPRAAPAGQVPVPAATLGSAKASTAPLYFPVKRCMNMGGALEAPREGEWGYIIQARHFVRLKEAGFDTVRLPIAWSEHTDTRPPYRIDPAFMARVKQVVRQAEAAGLGVIIDVHHYNEFFERPAKEMDRFEAIWRQISDSFAGASDKVYFEILNEPTNSLSAAMLNQTYINALSIIREKHPTRAVIIGGGSWNSPDALLELSWPDDPYLVATFHDYSPFAFTHQGASWTSDPMPMGRSYGSKKDLKEAQWVYSETGKWARRQGVPVFVGEFGVIDTVPLVERVEWTAERRRQIEQAGMSWCAWDFATRFPAYDLSNDDWLPGMKRALTGE